MLQQNDMRYQNPVEYAEPLFYTLWNYYFIIIVFYVFFQTLTYEHLSLHNT